jgi:hypothetical protein
MPLPDSRKPAGESGSCRLKGREIGASESSTSAWRANLSVTSIRFGEVA